MMGGHAWWMGAFAGAVLAVASVVVHAPSPPLEGDAVATVDGRPILRVDYERALEGLARASDRPVDAALRQRVLDRLIDQELLVQRGLELGLAERDPKVRLDLSTAVIELLSARGGHLADRTEEQLRRFHRERASYFTRAAMAAVSVFFVAPRPGEDEAATRARAGRVSEGLRGGRDVKGEVDPAPLETPRGRLPLAKLRDYLGGSATEQVAQLRPGEVTDPIATSGGWQVVVVTDRVDGQVPPFDAIRDQVVAAWRRDAGDRRLRTFLDERRARATIVVAEVTP